MKTLLIEFAIALDDDQRETIELLNAIADRMSIRKEGGRHLTVSYEGVEITTVIRLLHLSLGPFRFVSESECATEKLRKEMRR